jgi:Rieske Fe-S protein
VSVGELSRRSVLRGVGFTALGGVAGFVLAHGSDAAKAKRSTAAANSYGPGPKAGNETLTTLAELSDGGGVVTQGVVITRDASGDVHAFSATCTHQGCTVAAPSGSGTLDCPCHGSRFDADTGEVIQGPAVRPLPAVAVSVQGDRVVRG